MKRIVLLLVINISLVVSCAPATPIVTPTRSSTPFVTPKPTFTQLPSFTSAPTITIAPSFTSTLTSTPQPPLTDHEWKPETVLISINWSPGDGGGHIGDLGSPTFILYADGNLFMLNSLKIKDEYHVQVLHKKLNRLELCKHINTLDQIGYLDYSPSDYHFVGDKPFVIGASSTFITVNAWKSSFGDYYGLSDSLDEIAYYGQEGYPIISPALQTTYRFLDQYPSQGLEVYNPERILLWIVPAEYYQSVDLSKPVPTWQLKNLSLKTLIERAKVDVNDKNIRSIILDGQEARSVYNYLGDETVTRLFEQDESNGTKKYYAVDIRPLLPYELPGKYGGMSQMPAPGSPKPNFKLSCHPSDGVLPIPTPTNP